MLAAGIDPSAAKKRPPEKLDVDAARAAQTQSHVEGVLEAIKAPPGPAAERRLNETWEDARRRWRPRVDAVAAQLPKRYGDRRLGRGDRRSVRVCVTGSAEGQPDPVDVASAWATKPRDWLVLVGPTAAGKSSLTSAIFNHRLDKACALLDAAEAPPPRGWKYIRSVCRMMFAHSVDFGGEDDPRTRQAKYASILAIDDLGAELTASKPWVSATVREILLFRHNNRRPTVIATWLPKAELFAAYGGGVESRIRRAMDQGLFVRLRGRSADFQRTGRPR